MTLNCDISRTSLHMKVSDGSFFWIFHALSFDIFHALSFDQLVLSPEFPFKAIFILWFL